MSRVAANRIVLTLEHQTKTLKQIQLNHVTKNNWSDKDRILRWFPLGDKDK